MAPSGYRYLQIKTTETSANQIQSNARRLVDQMSVTRTQIEGEVRRIQQFIQQVRNFLSGSTLQALKRMCARWLVHGKTGFYSDVMYASTVQGRQLKSSPQLSSWISTLSVHEYLRSKGNVRPLRQQGKLG